MAEGLILDPTSESATNVQLDLMDGTSTFLLEASYPPPERESMWAGNADTEGDPLVQHKFRNRTISLRLRVVGSSAANLQQTLAYLQQKVAKIDREGGTLKRTAPSGDTIVFDLLGASIDIPITNRHLVINRAEPTLVFEAKPFGRGESTTYSTHSETTLPVLVFTETGVEGDVPALGQLEVTNGSATDQWSLLWGLQSRYYDSATTAKLFYEAEDLTPLNGASTEPAHGGTTVSGAGDNVMRSAPLTTSYQAVLSTQSSGGSHLTHTGAYRVYARVQQYDNYSRITFAFDWAQGDFRNVTRNEPVSIGNGLVGGRTWRLIDLGQVALTPPATGPQRWEGRLVAKAAEAVNTPGQTCDVDYLLFVPVDEGSGIASGVDSLVPPPSLAARDEFDQAAGALAGKTLPIGGTWSGAGDADDFAVETTGHTAQRTATTDAAVTSGRFGIAGTTVFTNTYAQTDLKFSAYNASGFGYFGLFARYVDTSNFLGVYVQPAAVNNNAVTISGRVAGAEVLNQSAVLATLSTATWYTLKIAISAGGRYSIWVYATGDDEGDPVMTGSSDVLATGGGLASGKLGLFDANLNATAITRNYDNFLAAAPVLDAALFGSQSGQVRHDGYYREDAAGAVWTQGSSYEGDYLYVPPAGREARTTRIMVKASRNDPAVSDSGIDDISATLTVTPRFLVVPE